VTWTTLLDPELTRRYGFNEAHAAWFTPRKCPAPPRNAITILIPECEIQFVRPGSDTVLVNRPKINRNIKYWLRYACGEARDSDAVLIIACDTVEQVQRAAKLAGKFLPKHERAAIERIYTEDARGRSSLN
jgi:hypothetical protein